MCLCVHLCAKKSKVRTASVVVVEIHSTLLLGHLGERSQSVHTTVRVGKTQTLVGSRVYHMLSCLNKTEWTECRQIYSHNVQRIWQGRVKTLHPKYWLCRK